MDERKDFHKWVIDLAFESQEGICKRCGASIEEEPYHIHHENGDNKDNSLSNISLLCIRCHHKTFPENAWEKHKAQEVKVLEMLNKTLEQASDPASKMSGATLEKLIEGLSMSLKVSRNATEVDYGMMRMPSSIRLDRRLEEIDAIADAYKDGFMDGLKRALEVSVTLKEKESEILHVE